MWNFRQILIFITLLLVSLSAAAATTTSSELAEQEVEQVRHGRHFTTGARKVVVTTPDQELTRRISERLTAHGATVVDGTMSKLFGARVVVARVGKIEGQSTAYSIEVGKSKIAIYYTTPEMLDAAIKQFYFLFDSPYGQRIIRGVNINFTADQPNKTAKNAVRRNSAGITDGVTTALPTSQIENAIRTQLRSNPGSDFMLAMVNRKTFRIDFSALRGINPAIGVICPTDTKYSTDQIRRFVAVAREAGGEFVPAIDLMSNNEAFKTYTGHEINSVEGMRFVRAMIEQCARQWNIRRICIGRRESGAMQQRYIDFLSDIATREGVTLIIL